MNKVAFLNGELGFHDRFHQEYFNKLNSNGDHVMLIDNLFNQPGKISQIPQYTTLVVGTVGFENKKINRLFEAFLKMNYIPERVIFAPNEDYFIIMARNFKGRTLFYRLDYINLEPYELNYLNEEL